MAKQQPIYTADAAADTIDYQPLSLVAVAGFLLAGAYAAVLLVGAIASYFKGEPFFEPFIFGSWGIVLPIGGAVLSALALWQISSSEGTQAGAGVAKWGLGLSLVCGVGYFTYQTFTELAVVQQANRFFLEKGDSSGFFPRLEGTDADVRSAYLLTLDPADRVVRVDTTANAQALDMPTSQNPKGLLTQFQECSLVRAIRVAKPGTVKVEPLAVRNWMYENRAFHILRGYRITTDEAVYEVPLKVSSVEPIAEGEKRRWKVDWQPLFALQLPPLSQTEVGRKRLALRQSAHEFLDHPETGWLKKLKDADALGTYLGTRRQSDRKDLQTRWEAIRAQTPIVAVTGASLPQLKGSVEENLRSKWLPKYWSLADLANQFKLDNIQCLSPELTAKSKEAAVQALRKERLPFLSLRVVPDKLAPCTETEAGEVLVTLQIEMVPSAFGQKGWPDLLLILKAVVAAPPGFDPATADASQNWRLQSLEFVRGWQIPRLKT